MTSTIGNPLSWGARNIGAAGRGLTHAVQHAGGEEGAQIPVVRPIDFSDIKAALSAGLSDFAALRSDVIFAAMLYPVIGICLMWAAVHKGVLPLMFPLASGFALIGPIAAIGLYELSRRREAGESPGWLDALSVWRAPGIGAIIGLGVGLAVLLVLWLTTAWVIYSLTMGGVAYPGIKTFLADVFTTPGGLSLMLIGIPVGFVFALLALAISVISFPLMLDRDVGLPRAVAASLELTRKSPVTVLTWGAIVAAGLIVGAIPMLLGLAVTLPILGHATWHLYRRAVR
jgi:uncharacterized membrane protein